MQSKIIERILTENNKTLQEIINVVKDNAIFNAVMSDVKEDYFVDDTIHGISHNERVALLACYIGIKEGLTDEELTLVLEAAKYHDIGRGYEENHGQYSTIIIDRNKEYIFPNLDDNEINIIKALCNGHSIDDKRYEEIAKLYGIKDIKQFKKLLDIVKDADALDRVRLPRFGMLDEKYLRTETSKGLTEFAENFFREYRNIQNQIPAEDKKIESTYSFSTELRDQLLYDGENYYLLRSLNRTDIDSLNSSNGIIPKIDSLDAHTVQDVMAQIRMQHRKTNLISMSEDPNIVLTYDKSNLHRFVLIRLSKEEIEDSKKVFSAGEYLLGVMDSEIERIVTNAPEKVREIIENVDKATTIEEIIKIINGQVPTSLVETQQQYLSLEEQLNQSKKIAKCKVLNYYGLMRGIAHDEKGKLIDISGFTQIMRNGFSSSEWLYSGRISQDKIINIPQILIDSLALLKQAEFQGKGKEIIRKIEKEVLALAISGEEINQENYQLEYSAHNDLKNDLTIDKAFEITNGEISYRDTNMQQIAIRSLAEMTLNKRKIIELLKERLPDIDIEGLFSDTYCINQEMVTRQNNKGSQIGRNINFLISDYGYDFDEETSRRILESVENLTDEQLKNIISQGINAQEISNLLIQTREEDQRIKSTKTKKKNEKYVAEAIVEGYNWKKDSNSLTIKEKELLSKALLRVEKIDNGLYKLYEAINKIQIGKYKFTQNEVFAIIINIALDRKIGDISYSDLLRKDIREIQEILLENKEALQTTVLPISVDLLTGKGKEVGKIKNELIDLGIDEELLEKVGIKNIYVAKNIIEQYFEDFKLSDKYKKALYQKILDNSIIKGEYFNLGNVIEDFLKRGMDLNNIYGIIINAAINGVAKDNTKYYYSFILNNVDNVREKIENEDINPIINEFNLEKAVSQTLSNKEKEKLYLNYRELGITLNSDTLFQNAYIVDIMLEKYYSNKQVEAKDLYAIKKCFFNDVSVKHCLISNCLTDLSNSGMSWEEMCNLLIRLAINRQGRENGVTYYNLLNNLGHVREKINVLREKSKQKINESSLLEARSQTLNKNEEENLISYLNNLGLSIAFFSNASLDNIYTVQQIVERYFENQNIDDKIKKSIIINLLKPLGASRESCYITSTLKCIQDEGYSFIEACGLIINMAMGKNVISEEDVNYSRILGSKNLAKKLGKYKGKIHTKVNTAVIEKAYWQSLNEDEKNRFYEDLEKKYGISKGIITLKSEFNLYLAKRIVDLYGEHLEDRNKGILIKSILNNSYLNKNKGVLLFSLMNTVEDLWDDLKKMSGMIVNLSLNDAVEQISVNYTETLQSANNTINGIKKYKSSIKTSITPIAILEAQINTMEIPEKEQILDEIEKIGIDSDTIKNVKFNNLMIGYLLLKKCCKKDNIVEENQKVFLKKIISGWDLSINATSNLVNTIKVLYDNGLNENEILHFLVNAATNGIIINNKKYAYKDIVTNSRNSHYELANNTNNIETKITYITILKAKSQIADKKEIEKITQRFIKNGIAKELLDERDERDIYVANHIIESVFKETTISEENKNKIIYYMLKNNTLNKKNNIHLITVLQNLEKMGLGENECYCLIINCAINGKLCKNCSYSDLLLGRKKSYELITEEVLNNNKTIDIETLRSIDILSERKIKGQDIAKATMELTAKGSGGSQICDDVQADYMRLLDEKTNNNQKEGSEQGDEN